MDFSCACGCRKHAIGEEISEQLEIVPMQIRVIKHVRMDRIRPVPLKPGQRGMTLHDPSDLIAAEASSACNGSITMAVFLRTLTPWRDCALGASRSKVFSAGSSHGLSQP